METLYSILYSSTVCPYRREKMEGGERHKRERKIDRYTPDTQALVRPSNKLQQRMHHRNPLPGN